MKINSESFSDFKKNLLRPSSNPIYNCKSSKWIKLITRLGLGRGHFCEHKFRHNFKDTQDTICSCRDDIETTIHYLLNCPIHVDERRTRLDNLENIGENIHDKNDFQISSLLLFGVSSNNYAKYFECYPPIHIRCVERFSTICTILKTWKTPMED